MHGAESNYDDSIYASPDEAEHGPDLDLVATSDDDYMEEAQPVKIEFGPWQIAEPFQDNGREKSAWTVLSSVRFVKVVSDGEIIDYCVEYGPVRRTHGVPVNGRPEFIEPTEDCERIYEMENNQRN